MVFIRTRLADNIDHASSGMTQVGRISAGEYLYLLNRIHGWMHSDLRVDAFIVVDSVDHAVIRLLWLSTYRDRRGLMLGSRTNGCTGRVHASFIRSSSHLNQIHEVALILRQIGNPLSGKRCTNP